MKKAKASLESIVAELGLLTETQREQLSLELEQMKKPTPQSPVNITQLAGLGKELWRQVDVDAYISEQRDEWDERKVR